MQLSTAARNRLPTRSFALPGRRYPIADASHARNALARVSQYGTPAEQATVRRKVHARFPGIGQKPRRLADRLAVMRRHGAFRES